ncbi:Flp family type IVb pilin [Thermanaerosceptrum fracticalcis]|uniref:Flp family type IVb pilin n=1 Tax=Thermanaerosceptrum fracticalcis TaxID=1712410 RepID=A0A7G6E4C3_THEFR|nr:Flp family type IVb pilin [Thermanaerosceptrum fracticalcis]QNB46927.1 Flp family type IVb pilin [Thermanaerosceptrum fracticalcis]
MLAMVKRLLVEEKGQGMAEYGLILALVALVVVAGLSMLGGGLDTLFKDVNSKLGTSTGGGTSP